MENSNGRQVSDGYVINLFELFSILWQAKYKILFITFLFALTSVFYALSIPNQYKAKVVLAPAKETSAIQGSLGQLGGLASLAGVSLDSGNLEMQVAQEVIKSWGFVERFIIKNNIAVELSAVIGWDEETNQLIYNEEIYNPLKNSWISETAEPTSWSLYENFMSRLTVSPDLKTGFVLVEIEYFSPHLAKEWIDLFVRDINQHMQVRKITEVTRNIDYLKEQIDKTSIAEMKEVFYSIIEEQIKSKMLARLCTNWPQHASISKVSATKSYDLYPWNIFRWHSLLALCVSFTPF